MWLMALATILNILGLVWSLVHASAFGFIILAAGITLSLVPWLKGLFSPTA